MKKTSLSVTVAILSVVAIAALLSGCGTAPATPTATTTAAPQIPSPALTNTPDPCAEENIEATITEFDKLSRQFSDAFVLAQNTPAAQLGNVIPQMQDIRRQAEDFKVPACLNTLKGYQLGFMNTAINTTLLLYSSFAGEKNFTQEQANAIFTQVNQQMAQANEYGNRYTAEMARLLGVTLPPPPPLPTLTPSTPVGTAATPQ